MTPIRFLCCFTLCLFMIFNVVNSDYSDTIRFSYSQFNSSWGDYFNGVNTVELSESSLQLCKDAPNQKGELWYKVPMQVRGFTTVFEFTVTRKSEDAGEGLAFVIHNTIDRAEGPGDAGMGYGDFQQGGTAGIRKSLAIEFDMKENPELNDPNGNHLSVHTLHADPNSANESASLKMTTSIPLLHDGKSHKATIQYLPKEQSGQLEVTLDSNTGPSLVVDLRLEDLFDLMDGGRSYVGLTASTGSASQSHVLESWSFQFLGEPDASNTHATGSGIQDATAGSAAVFTIQAVDQFGNNMITGGANLSVILVSEPSIAFTIEDNHDGTYTVSYTPTISISEAPLIVRLGDSQIKGSPFSVKVIPGPVFPANCLAFDVGEQTGLKNGVAGVRAEFSVQLRDQFKNNITDSSQLQNRIELDITGAAVEQVTGNLGADGIALVSYTLTVAGEYNLAITVDGKPITNPEHAITIAPAAISGSHCTVQGITPKGVAGETFSFLLQLKDEFNNNITSIEGQTPDVSVVLDGPVTVTGTATYSENGLYSITFKPVVSGNYEMNVKVEGQAVPGSPFSLEVLPANTVWPPNCFAYNVQNLSTAGLFDHYFVQVRDYFDNNITSEVAFIVWNVAFLEQGHSLPSTQASFVATHLGNGLYQITYNVTLSNTFTMVISINGTQIKGDPYSIHVAPGESYGPNCVASGAGLMEAVTDHKEVISLTSKDRFGNSKTVGGDQYQVTLHDKNDANKKLVVPTIEDLGNSTYSLSYVIKKSGEYQLEITLNGLSVDQSPYHIKCKWAGLSTPTILLIAGGCIAFIILVSASLWIYKKKFVKRRLYTPLE